MTAEICGWVVGNSKMYGPPLRRRQNVRMSQVCLRKCIRPLVTVNQSRPGWNRLRSFPHYYLSPESLFPSPGFEGAEFNRCAISLFASRPARTIFSTVVARLQLHRPTLEADIGSFFASTAHAIRANLFTSPHEDNTMRIAP